MDEKKDALVPVEGTEGPEVTPIETEYRQARAYFKESAVQAAKTNAALVTVLGLFVIRGLRYAWEALSVHFPWRRGR